MIVIDVYQTLLFWNAIKISFVNMCTKIIKDILVSLLT